MIENTPTQTQPIEPAPSVPPVQATQNKRSFIWGGLALVVILVLFVVFGRQMGTSTGFKMIPAGQENTAPEDAVDSNQTFVNNDIAVLTPTAAGELNYDQSTWQTVSRTGFLLKFPEQFFDESDSKYSTYYNPLTNNANYVTDNGIQFSYSFGLLADRDLRVIVEGNRNDDSDGNPEKFTQIQTVIYNGVEILSYETTDEANKEYYYYFRLTDQENWARVQATVRDPQGVGYGALVQQIMNTLSLSI
jgi:hypothetical protein